MILGSYVEIPIGVFVAAGLGSLIGLEREITGQPAGLRTHMILAVGAALAAMLSISFSYDFSSPEFRSDPARIVAQVVSGVGFLGAGAILRAGFTIKGLTTASSLWTTAIIGIACGSGYYKLAAITTVMVFVILTIINKIESLVLLSYKTHMLKITLEDRPGIINDVKEMLADKKVKVVSLNASMPDKETLKLSLAIRKPNNLGMDSIINLMNSLNEAKSMEID
jgi:putative Mg2+ transporter-C (MgtC) family protein